MKINMDTINKNIDKDIALAKRAFLSNTYESFKAGSVEEIFQGSFTFNSSLIKGLHKNIKNGTISLNNSIIALDMINIVYGKKAKETIEELKQLKNI